MSITRDKEMELRSSDYEHLIGTAGADLIAGEVTLVEEDLGFPLVDVANGKQYTSVIKASQVRAEKAAEAISAGDKLFWDAANSVVTKTSGVGLYPCGSAIEAALLGDTYVLMNFDGRLTVIVT